MHSQQTRFCKYENVGSQGHGHGQLNVMIKVNYLVMIKVNFRLCVIQKTIHHRIDLNLWQWVSKGSNSLTYIKLSSEWERYKLCKEPFSLSLHQNYQINNVTNLKKQVSIVSLINATHKATLLSNWWNWSKYFKEFHISCIVQS